MGNPRASNPPSATDDGIGPDPVVPEQAIICAKCGQSNPPQEVKCIQCKKDLLPGLDAGQRACLFGCSTVVGIASLAAAVVIFMNKVEVDGKGMIYLAGLVIFGFLVFSVGAGYAVRKVPLHERYAQRAECHVEINPIQAIADYGSASKDAPRAITLVNLTKRAALCQKIGRSSEARSSWQQALEILTFQIEKLKLPDPELLIQRAELYRNLGLTDEATLEMLRYTIEKEASFKFKQDEIAMGVSEGWQKGTEDQARGELQKVRAELLMDKQYRIVGDCKQCRKTVALDQNLRCTNNLKHHQIRQIRAEKRS
jgi:hypothetical protein